MNNKVNKIIDKTREGVATVRTGLATLDKNLGVFEATLDVAETEIPAIIEKVKVAAAAKGGKFRQSSADTRLSGE